MEIYDLRVELTQACQGRAEYVEKEESLVWGFEIEDLKARSAAELAKAKSDVAAIMASYRADAEAANAWAREISSTVEAKLSNTLDHARRQSRRMTLEEIHARSFDLSADIEAERILEEEAASMLSDEDDSTGVSESEGDGDEVPEGKALEDAAAKDEESLVWGFEIEDHKARSAAELAKAKSDVAAIMASYRADAEVANAWAREISSTVEAKLSNTLDHARRQSRRMTLEEIHARSFDLSADIEAERILEEEAASMLSDEDDSTGVSKSEGDGDEVPEGEALEDAAAKDVTPK
ncbi:uncharacterized protein [Nicotiana sylvestris]|uniref:uncharacterized protein n=1 Tax=Nicotiana sylvestris TaxID=4096 RepID=UPI00388CC5F4